MSLIWRGTPCHSVAHILTIEGLVTLYSCAWSEDQGFWWTDVQYQDGPGPTFIADTQAEARRMALAHIQPQPQSVGAAR